MYSAIVAIRQINSQKLQLVMSLQTGGHDRDHREEEIKKNNGLG
jgi:hypothetical protein